MKQLFCLCLLSFITLSLYAQRKGQVNIPRAEYDEIMNKLRQAESLRQENETYKKRIDSLNTQLKNNNQAAKDKEIADLKARIKVLEATHKQDPKGAIGPDPCQLQLKQAKDSLSAQQKKITHLEDELFKKNNLLKQAEAKTQKAETEAAQKAKENQSLQQDLAKNNSIRTENETLRQQVFKDLDKQINDLLPLHNFAATQPKMEALRQQIEQLKKSNPQFVNSLSLADKKADWYLGMIKTIEQAQKTLDEAYDLKKVTEAIVLLEQIEKSPTVQPSTEQAKIIATQKALLSDYCNKHNYTANKMEDANYFGAAAGEAIKEIDTALRNIDKGYTFLIKKLEERKKNPTNKNISLDKATCPN